MTSAQILDVYKRQVLYLGGVFVLPVLFGVTSIFYTEAISDFGGTVMSIAVYIVLIRKILNLSLIHI